MEKRNEPSLRPWMYRLFWVGFHASTALVCGMLALYSKDTFMPWGVWAFFGLITAYLGVRNYGKWHDGEIRLRKLKEKSRGKA